MRNSLLLRLQKTNVNVLAGMAVFINNLVTNISLFSVIEFLSDGT